MNRVTSFDKDGLLCGKPQSWIHTQNAVEKHTKYTDLMLRII